MHIHLIINKKSIPRNRSELTATLWAVFEDSQTASLKKKKKNNDRKKKQLPEQNN